MTPPSNPPPSGVSGQDLAQMLAATPPTKLLALEILRRAVTADGTLDHDILEEYEDHQEETVSEAHDYARTARELLRTVRTMTSDHHYA